MEKTKLKLKVLTGKPQFNTKLKDGLLLVEIKSNPEKGKANKEIIKGLKKIFRKEVKIISGLKNKEKIVEIDSSIEEIMKRL
jgi:uncharacterized protein (TIGR00251 family)